jgi:hypothetical protein
MSAPLVYLLGLLVFGFVVSRYGLYVAKRERMAIVAKRQRTQGAPPKPGALGVFRSPRAPRARPSLPPPTTGPALPSAVSRFPRRPLLAGVVVS